MKAAKRIGNFYRKCKFLKTLFRTKTDSEAEQNYFYCIVIKNSHNPHKQPSANRNMLLKTFELESWLQKCASTALNFDLRYATLALIMSFEKRFALRLSQKIFFFIFSVKRIIF